MDLQTSEEDANSAPEPRLKQSRPARWQTIKVVLTPAEGNSVCPAVSHRFAYTSRLGRRGRSPAEAASHWISVQKYTLLFARLEGDGGGVLLANLFFFPFLKLHQKGTRGEMKINESCVYLHFTHGWEDKLEARVCLCLYVSVHPSSRLSPPPPFSSFSSSAFSSSSSSASISRLPL